MIVARFKVQCRPDCTPEVAALGRHQDFPGYGTRNNAARAAPDTQDRRLCRCGEFEHRCTAAPQVERSRCPAIRGLRSCTWCQARQAAPIRPFG
jgi:hypothetical protein